MEEKISQTRGNLKGVGISFIIITLAITGIPVIVAMITNNLNSLPKAFYSKIFVSLDRQISGTFCTTRKPPIKAYQSSKKKTKNPSFSKSA